jgi:hypothetical protein
VVACTNHDSVSGYVVELTICVEFMMYCVKITVVISDSLDVVFAPEVKCSVCPSYFNGQSKHFI